MFVDLTGVLFISQSNLRIFKNFEDTNERKINALKEVAKS
jgi:hypothetical protein